VAIEIDFMESFDQKSMVAELRRIAKKLGKRTLTYADIDTHGRTNPQTIKQKFGTMQEAHKAAGLVPPKRRLDGAELLEIIVRLWKTTLKKSGRSPFAYELKKYNCPASLMAITNRFGTWNKALVAAATVAPASLAKVIPRSRKPERKPISDSTRFHVFKRDGYKCRICKRAAGQLEVDHVIPRALGGPHRLSNFQTLCKRCNRGKSANLQ